MSKINFSMSRVGRVYLQASPIPDWADTMTLADFNDGVKSACFTNDDGVGYYAHAGNMFRAAKVDCAAIFSGNTKDQKGYTHVVWFNK